MTSHNQQQEFLLNEHLPFYPNSNENEEQPPWQSRQTTIECAHGYER